MTTDVVRPRTDADIEGCAHALREVHRVDGYPVEGVADAVGWLWPSGLMQAWVAGEPDRILGHVAMCEPRGEAAVTMLVAGTDLTEAEIAVVARLFVVPSARRRSLGQRLAAAAFGYAADRGRRVVFDVMAKDRDAIRLYERLGCVRLGATSHRFGDGETTTAYCYAAPERQRARNSSTGSGG